MSKIKEDLKMFNQLAEMLLEEEVKHPVAERIEANELQQMFNISLNENPISDETFKKVLKKILMYTPKTASTRFFNQLFGGRQSKAVLGDLLAVMLNNSMYTYKVAGLQVGIEQEIIHLLNEKIGYGEQSNGTFSAGGSLCNYMALIMARDRFNPDCRNHGITDGMVIYTSRESHYSNAKNASFSGIGRNSVRYIDVDEKGRMLPQKLEEQILYDLANSNSPFYVNATAGTTLLGTFDPIDDIADICEKYNLWLHVDGAYSGAVFFSSKHKYLLKGVERSDSFSFNAHKMLGTPLTCSIILVKDKKNLHYSFSNQASYLYQTENDEFNLGKTSLQCGRRNDAFKLWTLWKFVGTKGLEEIVDKQFRLADFARNYVRNHKDYELYSFNDSISICFKYKDIDSNLLCTSLYENNIALVGFGTFNENTFVRLVTINATNEEEDILNFFKVIEEFVENNLSLLETIVIRQTV